MKRRKIRGFMLFMLISLLLCSALTQTASAAVVDVYLKAVATNKTMPDGTNVPMWGFASCDSTFLVCGAASIPGPALTANQGDTLNINLRNNLTGAYTEPVSLIIPGQIAPMNPVWIDNAGVIVSTGARPGGDVTSRMRSLTTERPVHATNVTTYTWTDVKAGTYLYLSGSHGSLQIPMGLFGSLTVLSAVGQAYPANPNVNSTFAAEQILLFSEIDPVINQSVADGTYGTPPGPTSSIGYHPRYFLINGEPFTYGRSPAPVAAVGQRTLLRFLNAGLFDHTPILQGIYGEAIAEDGNLYPFGKKQYSLQLPAGKTVDVIITPSAAGYIPLYDRMLSLTNAAESPGGMMLYLEVPSPTQHSLIVSKSGSGTGTARTVSLPGGILCETACLIDSETYNDNTLLKLEAVADSGSVFIGWTGDCAGTGNCLLTMDSAKTVSAEFNLGTMHTLTVTGGGGTGPGGTITGPGINCTITGWIGSGDCTEQYPLGTVVSLMATGAAGSALTSWSGACTGSDACSVTMDNNKMVAAQFDIIAYTLNVNGSGTGSGNVSGPGISCAIVNGVAGGDCTETFVPGTPVALNAVASGGSTFTNWSGVCTGTGVCNMTMDADKIATAQFDTVSILTVNGTGTGSGNVSGPGISCAIVNGVAGGDCTETFITGTPVALNAIANGGSTFTGWLGACAGTGACNTTMLVDRTVTAGFTALGPTITVTIPGVGTSWAAGTGHQIQWTYTGNTGNYVRIELRQGGTLSSTLSTFSSIGTGGNGAYTWNIPASQAGGTAYQIRVTSLTNGAVTGTSNFFTITGPPPPTIAVTTPAGGENWAAGTAHQIQWTYAGSTGASVRIELMNSAGGTVIGTIANSVSIGTGGNGSYNWNIPAGQAGGDYRIRVTSTSNAAVTSTSSLFTITGPPPPTITVTVPNGGESWRRNTGNYIRWTYTGDPGTSVRIELLNDPSGSVNRTITAGVSRGSGGSGSYYWFIPYNQTPAPGNYRIRVTSTTNGAVTDVSDNIFTIAP